MNDRLRIAAAAFTVLIACAMSAQALDLNDVIRLKLAGVSEETIVQVAEQEDAVFTLTVDDIIDLKDAGASEWLIRQLMATSDPSAAEAYGDKDEEGEAESYGGYSAYDDYEPGGYDAYYNGYRDADYLDPYDYTTVFVYQYYDPFAYYWYPYPRTYLYYSPFWWSHAGFYFAGHYCWDWWDPWDSCTWFWDTHYGYDHHFGPSHTRVREGRSWHGLDPDAIRVRADRERAILDREGLTATRARVTERTAERTRLLLADQRVRSSSSDRLATAERARTRAASPDRPRYRTAERRTSRGDRTPASRRGSSIDRGAPTRHSGAAGGREAGPRTTGRSRDDGSRPEYRDGGRSRGAHSSSAPSVSRGSSRSSSSSSSSRSTGGRSSSSASHGSDSRPARRR